MFRGRLERKEYARLLKRSHIHCYFTREFVPSWSLIDAMSTGCLLVVNKTASVKDILPDDGVVWIDDITQESIHNGLCEAMELINREPKRVEMMRNKCRRNAVEKFERKESIEKWFKLIREGRL